MAAAGSRFVLPTRRRRLSTPRAKDIVLAPRLHVAPPAEIVAKLQDLHLVVGIDIETHDILGRHMRWWTGPFGFATLADPFALEEARVVRIGWAVHAKSEGPVVKEFLVRPAGFEVSAATIAVHGITHEAAMARGAPLQDVMLEFMRDLSQAHDLGGRLVAHHLEFNAGIVSEELARAGLSHFQELWREIAKGGICTADPDIAHCTRELVSLEPVPWKNATQLEIMCSKLLPQCKHLSTKKSWAGAGAQLVTELYRELSQRANTQLADFEHAVV